MQKIVRADVIHDDNTIVSLYPVAGTDPAPTIGDPDFTMQVGHVLMLDAPSSMLPGGSEYRDLFEWDFGDVSSGSIYNTPRGFNAAHLFDTAGTYTMSLVHTPEGLTGSPASPVTKTWQVLVAAPSQQSIYVSNSIGNDANPGTVDLPVKSISKALLLAQAFDRIYLKRGDVWRVPNNGVTNVPFTISKSGLEFRDYGSGNLPIVEAPVQDGLVIFDVWADNVVFRNVYFRSLDTGFTVAGTSVFGIRKPYFSAIGCQTERMATFVNGDKTPPTTEDDPITNGIFLANCYDGLGDLCCRNQWVNVAYSRWSIYGCKAYDSVYESTVRAQGTTGFRLLAINGGEFGNNDRSKTRLGTSGITPNASPTGKGAIMLLRGSYGWVDGVTIKSDAVLYADGALSAGPEPTVSLDATALVDHVVIRNCVDRSDVQDTANNSQPVQLQAWAGLRGAAFVGNSNFQRIYVEGTNAVTNQTIQNLYLRGNTMKNAIVNNSPDNVTLS